MNDHTGSCTLWWGLRNYHKNSHDSSCYSTNDFRDLRFLFLLWLLLRSLPLDCCCDAAAFIRTTTTKTTLVWYPHPISISTTAGTSRTICCHPPQSNQRRWNTPLQLVPIVSLQQSSNHHPNCCESTISTLTNTTSLTTEIIHASNTSTSISSSTTAATLSFFNQHHYLSGVWVLLTVPLAWGTYTPVVKYLYTIQQPPVPGILFSAAYYIIAAITLWTIVQKTTTTTRDGIVNEPYFSILPASMQLQAASDGVRNDNQTSKMTFVERNDDVVPITSSTITTSDMAIDSNSSSSLSYWYGGIELGMYLFTANLLQIIGLQSVPADRAGFLIQLTTIFVPLLEAVAVLFVWYHHHHSTTTDTSHQGISKGNHPIEFPTMIPPRTWMACLLAFVGVIVFDRNVEDILPIISTTTTTATTILQDLPHILWNTVGNIGTGDSLIIAAAVLYSLHVIRLGRYAKVCDALPLAASKATVEAILSIGLVTILTIGRDHDVLSSLLPLPMNGIAMYVSEAGQEIQTFLTSITTLLSSNGMVDAVTMLIPALCAILWTGWVTCAYTIFAQSYGQSRVPPTEANLVYSIQPLCTALFAYVLLGETLSPSGFVGAAFIAAAVYIVAVPDEKGSVE